MLGCDLFIGKSRNVCSLAGVLDRDAADIAALIEIQNSVLVQVLRFGYFGRSELDVERISVLKIFDVHDQLLHFNPDGAKPTAQTARPARKRVRKAPYR
jgi:hypothetical protein